MFLDTKFLSLKSSAAVGPATFNAATYARNNFPKVRKLIADHAVDITKLAPLVDRNLPAAGKRYGQSLGAGNFAFCVKARGRVRSVDSDFAIVKVAGLPAKDVVRIPLAYALNGSPVRDCTGTIAFGDFTDQTDYQDVSDEFKLIIQRQVIAPAKLRRAIGATVAVVGGFASGGPPHSFIIQPVAIERAR